jgi:CTP:molybdopterin cytidylyltransferase MocA
MARGDNVASVRRAMLAWLKRDPNVTSQVEKSSIYGGTVLADRIFPFIRLSVTVVTPFVATGLDSTKIRASLHAFAHPVLDESGVIVMAADQKAGLITTAIAGSLDGAVLPLSGGMKAHPIWLRSRLVPDPHQAAVWQGIVDVRAEVSG